MNNKVSKRLLEIIDALPLKQGIRILEIGCGTGIAAGEIIRRIGSGFILGIDRSPKAIEQAKKNNKTAIADKLLAFEQKSIESFEWIDKKNLFDFAFAIRVGALDGRHPEVEEAALKNIRFALKPGGKLYIDGGSPLKEIKLKR